MTDVTSVLGALGALATGGSVSLGPVVFTGFEVPSRINFGGTQQLVIHKFPGGTRIIDSLGDDPAAPEWKGTFTGALAAARARQVNALRLAAQPVPLSFGPFTAQVVIKRFAASYERNGFWIPYSIACEVLPPQAEADGVGGTALAGLIGADAASALAGVSNASAQLASVATAASAQASGVLAQVTPLGSVPALNLAGIAGALGNGTSLISGVANLAQSPGAAAQALAQFRSAATGIGSALGAVGGGIGLIGGTAAAAGTGDPVASVNDLVNAASLSGAAATLAQAGGAASRAAINAATATTPGSIGP